MKYIFVTIASAIFLVFAFLIAPISPSFDLRNNLGDEAVKKGNYETAKWFYRSTSLMGSMRGQNNLAVIDYAERRYAKGLNERQKAAVTHSAQAVFFDLSKRSFAPALYNNGLFHYRCSVSRSCYKKAKRRFARAAELGDPLAPLAYAMQLTSKREHPDRQERTELLEKLAKQSNPVAAVEYAEILRRDGASEQERLPFIEIGAKAGIRKAQEILGIDKSRQDYAKWLLKAAKNGSTLAAFRLAEYYDTSLNEEDGDLSKAFHWYSKTIEINQTRKQRILPLSEQLEIHTDGLRFKRIVQRGGLSGLAAPYKAAYRLGQMYLIGQGVERDWGKAAEAFGYASVIGVKDSGLMRTLLEWDKPTAVLSREKHYKRLGYETILSWQKDTLFEPPQEILELIRDGKLRAVTQIDIERWQSSNNDDIDPDIVERIVQSENWNNYLLPTSKTLKLPKLNDSWFAMPIVLSQRNQNVSAPKDTYKLLNLNTSSRMSVIE